MYNRDTMVFLPRIEHIDKNKYLVAVFLDDDMGYVTPPSFKDVNTPTHTTVGTFDPKDFPSGDHRVIQGQSNEQFKYLPNDPQVVVEFGKHMLRIANHAPEHGYYLQVELEVHDNTSVTSRVENIDSELLGRIQFSEDEELLTKGTQIYNIHAKPLRGFKLDQPNNEVLTQEQLNELGFHILSPEWLMVWEELMSVYFNLVAFAFNRDYLLEVVEGKNKQSMPSNIPNIEIPNTEKPKTSSVKDKKLMNKLNKRLNKNKKK